MAQVFWREDGSGEAWPGQGGKEKRVISVLRETGRGGWHAAEPVVLARALNVLTNRQFPGEGRSSLARCANRLTSVPLTFYLLGTSLPPDQNENHSPEGRSPPPVKSDYNSL